MQKVSKSNKRLDILPITPQQKQQNTPESNRAKQNIDKTQHNKHEEKVKTLTLTMEYLLNFEWLKLLFLFLNALCCLPKWLTSSKDKTT